MRIKITQRVIRVILFITLITQLSLSFADDIQDNAWSYTGLEGPIYWSEINATFKLCSTGQRQSPINIPNTYDAINQPGGLLKIGYHSAPFNFIDTSHGWQVTFAKNNSLSFSGKTYSLIQFHIHTPGENQIQGQKFPAEIHFVNQSSDGRLLVIAVFIQEGKNNPALENILKDFSNPISSSHYSNAVINPLDLIPDFKNYYNFSGSLTTPPCSEGVQWIVIDKPIEASLAQIDLIKQANHGVNERPIQNLHGRRILKIIG